MGISQGMPFYCVETEKLVIFREANLFRFANLVQGTNSQFFKSMVNFDVSEKRI